MSRRMLPCAARAPPPSLPSHSVPETIALRALLRRGCPRRCAMKRRMLSTLVILWCLAGGARSSRGDVPPQGRLGQDVVPTFEAIHLTVDADKHDYAGTVRITLRARQR